MEFLQKLEEEKIACHGKIFGFYGGVFVRICNFNGILPIN